MMTDSSSESTPPLEEQDHSAESQPQASPGVSRLDMKLEIAPGDCFELSIEARTPQGEVLDRQTLSFQNPAAAVDALPGVAVPPLTPSPRAVEKKPVRAARPAALPWARLGAALAGWQAWLFGGSIVLYLVTHLVGLAKFPIFFFTDEAVQTVLASDLVRDHFLGYAKEFLPTFFPNGGQYNLSVSVYLQVIPYLLFDKSIWITRGVAALATVLAAFAVGRILKDIYHSPHPWTAILLLSTAPAWFLHSRTAFETALAASFYAGFIYFYMMYRTVSPRYLYAAVGMGALAFYTYSPAQMYMAVTAVLLLISDIRYHWQQRAFILRGFGLALLLVLPYARYLYDHPTENLKHMQILNSYWVQDLTLAQKLGRFGSEYLRGLDPAYWFLPNDTDFVRHRMNGYGHLLRLSLPFVIGGVVLAVRKIRFSPNRVILIALLAGPTGAALVGLGVTRVLVMVIPFMLLAALALSALMVWLERYKLPRPLLAGAVFLVLGGFNLYLLNDSLTNGPTWYHEYGLGGMQYGAQQLFTAVHDEYLSHPGDKIVVSPSWANGTDVLARFFFGDQQPFQLGSIDGYLRENIPLDSTHFFMIPEEMEQAAASGKFKDIRLENVLFFPDGRPGFYAATLRYADNIDAILAGEQKARRVLRSETVTWNGETVLVRYPALDMGKIADAFDGDDQSILRTMEANPLALDLNYVNAKPTHGFGFRIGGTPQKVTLIVNEKGNSKPLYFSETLSSKPDPRYVYFQFPRAIDVQSFRVEILSIYDEEPAHVHLWEVKTW